MVIDGAHDNKFMVGAHALAAKDTLAEVPDDERIGLLQAGIMGHGIEINFTHTQIGRHLPQLTSVTLVTHNAGFRVIGHHHADDIFPVVSDNGRVRPDFKLRGYGGGTGGHDAPAFFILHQTEPARTRGFQVGVMAKGRDFDAVFMGCV
jgi:hypothetical protein